MERLGLLETMAQADLDAVIESVGARYRPGAIESLMAVDPEWATAIERAEREVGGLYGALREADLTLARWRRAVATLRELWERAGEVASEPMTLREVA